MDKRRHCAVVPVVRSRRCRTSAAAVDAVVIGLDKVFGSPPRRRHRHRHRRRHRRRHAPSLLQSIDTEAEIPPLVDQFASWHPFAVSTTRPQQQEQARPPRNPALPGPLSPRPAPPTVFAANNINNDEGRGSVLDTVGGVRPPRAAAAVVAVVGAATTTTTGVLGHPRQQGAAGAAVPVPVPVPPLVPLPRPVPPVVLAVPPPPPRLLPPPPPILMAVPPSPPVPALVLAVPPPPPPPPPIVMAVPPLPPAAFVVVPPPPPGNNRNTGAGPLLFSATTTANATASTSTSTSTTNAPRSWIHVEANGFQEAVSILERGADANDGVDPTRPINYFTVKPLDGPRQGDDSRSFFGRFVTLLGHMHEGGGGVRDVRSIALMPEWGLLPDEDMELLFRDVLPRHRTIRSISIWIGGLAPRFLRMLTDNVPETATATAKDTTTATPPLLKLSLFGSGGVVPAIRSQVADAVVSMLNRNAAIKSLSVHIDLGADNAKRICQSVPRNKNLRALELIAKDVFPDTLHGVAESSSLQSLTVSGSFSDGAVRSLAKQLRTNEMLQRLGLLLDLGLHDRGSGSGGIRDSQQDLLDLVKTYNHTLTRLFVMLGSDHSKEESARLRDKLNGYTRRNSRTRRALIQLQDANDAAGYGPQCMLDARMTARTHGWIPGGATTTTSPLLRHCREAVPSALLAKAMERVNGQPTLLLRAVKRFYVNVVCNSLRAKQEHQLQLQQQQLQQRAMPTTATTTSTSTSPTVVHANGSSWDRSVQVAKRGRSVLDDRRVPEAKRQRLLRGEHDDDEERKSRRRRSSSSSTQFTATTTTHQAPAPVALTG